MKLKNLIHSMNTNEEKNVPIETPLLVAAEKKEFVVAFFINTIRRLIKPKFITRNIQIILDLLIHYSADINANHGCRKLRACIIQVKNIVELMISERDAGFLSAQYTKIFAGTSYYNASLAAITGDVEAKDIDEEISPEELANMQQIYRDEIRKKRAFKMVPRYSAGEIVECKSNIVNNKWSVAVVQAIFRYDNKIYYIVKYGNRNDMLDYISAASKRIRAFKSCRSHSIVYSNRRYDPNAYSDDASILKNTLVVANTANDVDTGDTSDE